MHVNTEVETLLRQWNLDAYIGVFEEMEVVDMDTLQSLTDEDVASMIGANIEERNKLRRALGRACEASPPSYSHRFRPDTSGDTDRCPSQSSSAAPSSNDTCHGSSDGHNNTSSSSPSPFPRRGKAANHPNGQQQQHFGTPPGMARYHKLLKKKGMLLAKPHVTSEEIRDVEREIQQVMRELNLEGAPLVHPRRGDKVRIIGYPGCSAELGKLSGHSAVVMTASSEEMWSAVKVRLQQTGDVIMVPPHCIQHAAESRLAQRFKGMVERDGAAGGVSAASQKNSSRRSTAVRRVVERERQQRADPFTLHGFRTNPIYGRLAVELVLQPHVSPQQVSPVLTSATWVDRGVLPDTVHYNRDLHALTLDMVSNKMVHAQLESELHPLCISFTVRRRGGAERDGGCPGQDSSTPASAPAATPQRGPAGMGPEGARGGGVRPQSAGGCRQQQQQQAQTPEGCGGGSGGDGSAGPSASSRFNGTAGSGEMSELDPLPNPNPNPVSPAASGPPLGGAPEARGHSGSTATAVGPPPPPRDAVPRGGGGLPSPPGVGGGVSPRGGGVGGGGVGGGSRASKDGVPSALFTPDTHPLSPTSDFSELSPGTRRGEEGRRKQGGAAAFDLASLRGSSGNPAPSRCSSFRSTVPPSTCGSLRQKEKLTGVQVEDDLRIRLNEALNKCTRLKNEVSQYRAKDKKSQRNLNLQTSIANANKKESESLRKRNSAICQELHKLHEALDVVMTTLSGCSAQWADQLAKGADEESSRISRGVISEVIATNHEIREKMRHISLIANLTNRPPNP